MFTAEDLAKKASRLSHVDTVVRKAPIDLDELREKNPTLAAFYEKELMESTTTVLKLVIGNTATPVPEKDGWYKWTLFLHPQENSGVSIRSVIFDLHPTFNPASVSFESPPYEVTRTGWGTFEVGITIVDTRGSTHRLSHHLSFDAESSHEEVVVVEGSEQQHANAPQDVQRMAKSLGEVAMHGHLGVGQGWTPPTLVTYCDEEARPGYRSMKAHEYNEDPLTLRAKVRVLANLVRESPHCIAYTGAGISTASGIDDYASKAAASVATGRGVARPKKRGLDAEPTFAHFVLGALHREGMLKHWVQQNHDGLPQKAGFSQSCLNEIHGSWFDPANPVVPMNGSLRGDLNNWLYEEEQAADLVLTMGTSLCGMNADRVVDTPARKFLKGTGRGAVIINFQRTQMDDLASLRIFAKIDEVMLLLAWELGVSVPTTLYSPSVPPTAVGPRPHTFSVPYGKNGKKTDKRSLLDLSPGAKVQLTGGPGKGFKGTVERVPGEHGGNYTMRFPCNREHSPEFGKKPTLYAFGAWWVEAAAKGEVPIIPVVNC